MSKRFAVCDESGKVVNVILMDDTAYPTNWYPGYGRYLVALEVAQWPSEPIHPTKMIFNPVQVQGRCGPGDTINLTTGVVTPLTPAVPSPPTKEELRAHAADKRWQVETGGCVWGAHRVHTDRESQPKLIAAFVAVNAGLRQDGAGWKMAAGNYVSLTNQEMLAVCATALGHIEQAFNVEETLLAGIEAGSITTLAQIDQASWPGA